MTTFIYKSVGQLEIAADVHPAGRGGPRPVVVWIHPGGFVMGSRRMLPADQLERLTAAGLTVVAIDHRLVPESTLDAIEADVSDALGRIRGTGPELFGADPSRLAVMGASAGAHLALVAAASVRPPVSAAVALYGYGDVNDAWFARPDPFFAALPAIDAATARRAIGRREVSEGDHPRNDFYVHCRQAGTWPNEVSGSSKRPPVETLIDSSMPPTLLLHGDRDVDVPIQMSERLADVLAPAASRTSSSGCPGSTTRSTCSTATHRQDHHGACATRW